MVSTGDTGPDPLPVGTTVAGAFGPRAATPLAQKTLTGRFWGELRPGAARTHAKRWASRGEAFGTCYRPGGSAGAGEMNGELGMSLLFASHPAHANVSVSTGFYSGEGA